jgi:hypothetical protein
MAARHSGQRDLNFEEVLPFTPETPVQEIGRSTFCVYHNLWPLVKREGEILTHKQRIATNVKFIRAEPGMVYN